MEGTSGQVGHGVVGMTDGRDKWSSWTWGSGG
jgi:hypothetical protein